MNRVMYILVLASIAAVAAVVVQQRKAAESSVATTADVQTALSRLYDRASYFGALENSPENANTLWPVAVLPEWFGEELPVNGLLPDVATDSVVTTNRNRPWIDVAPPGDSSAHPPDPVAVRRDQAQFWYNPNLGVFRARVAPTLNNDDALALYNQLNGVELPELDRSADPSRTPLAYTPGQTPAATLASRDRSASTTDAAGDAGGGFSFTIESEAPRQPSLFNPDPAATYPELQPPAPAEPERPRGRSRLKDREG